MHRLHFLTIIYYTDEIGEEEVNSIKEWLKSNRGPPSKVFEKLNQSAAARLKNTRSGVAFSEIVDNWPRLFDVDGAVSITAFCI